MTDFNEILLDIENDTLDASKNYGDNFLNGMASCYVLLKNDKMKALEHAKIRIQKINHDLKILRELKIEPKYKDEAVQIRYESGETVLLKKLKTAYDKWFESKDSFNKVWKISWYNIDCNYRILYDENNNEWINETIDGLYITSYTMKEFEEFCKAN